MLVKKKEKKTFIDDISDIMMKKRGNLRNKFTDRRLRDVLQIPQTFICTRADIVDNQMGLMIENNIHRYSTPHSLLYRF